MNKINYYVCCMLSLPTSPVGAIAMYCDEYVSVCVSVCLFTRISTEPHA